MLTSDLDFDLPEALIAQHPSEQRDASRLLVVDRATQTFHVDVFRNLPQYLQRGDCVVLNQTRVIRARLRGRKPSGGEVEAFLLRERAPGEWEVMLRPSARVRDGATVSFGDMQTTAGAVLKNGHRILRFERSDVLQWLEESGAVPLPPYVRRDTPDASDLTRYQTIYATSPGAVAAPTAGLHFTQDVFDSLATGGVQTAALTLHVGYGTFSPIRAEQVEDHKLEPELFDFPSATADVLNATRAKGGRVVAVGTTSTRVLEMQYRGDRFEAGAGSAGLFIYPPYRFRAVDMLQTNFHLPRSSLLALVYAFAGEGLARAAYQYAIREQFRFYSYGDVMLIR